MLRSVHQKEVDNFTSFLPVKLRCFQKFCATAMQFDSIVGFASRHELLDSLSDMDKAHISDAFDELSNACQADDVRVAFENYLDHNMRSDYKSPQYVCISTFLEIRMSMVMRGVGEDV